jgi:cell division protein ZapA
VGEVKLQIADRTFAVSCADGEEEQLMSLAKMVDEKARAAGNAASLTESRMLLFASLLLADELAEVRALLNPDGTPIEPSLSDENVTKALEKLADRIESFANKVVQGGTNA